ncbi:hypothetical protein [Rummeliibacillus pycnus]|uniref:hypothetical protein n=1 Tax=Rummeliibacillus pycnus TaxID=101070 RepID=UPI0037C8056B
MNIVGNNILILIITIVICSFLLYWIIKNAINNSIVTLELKKIKDDLAKITEELDNIKNK